MAHSSVPFPPAGRFGTVRAVHAMRRGDRRLAYSGEPDGGLRLRTLLPGGPGRTKTRGKAAFAGKGAGRKIRISKHDMGLRASVRNLN